MYATIVGCSLSVLQQLSGINAVMFYSSTIFTKAGVSGRLGTAIVGFVNMASTFIALFLLGSKLLSLINLSCRIRSQNSDMDPIPSHGSFPCRSGYRLFLC